MEKGIKISIILLLFFCIACSSDDDKLYGPEAVESNFKMNNKVYSTPFGHYQKDNSVNNVEDRYVIFLFNIDLIPITEEDGGILCSSLSDLNQGITIYLNSSEDNILAPGNYKYTNDSSANSGFTGTVFHDAHVEGDFCETIEVNQLEISGGEFTVSKNEYIYTITYIFTSNDITIKGSYQGELRETTFSNLL
ncbi:hypothetical protein [Aquimarina sp. AU58]|uniref:hypothetical protein n=1 Tax=Aquimarina sp. AU58 TaxID=1874112 RepID=UPI000D6DE125|nr:hypothetical protein [Aquimarina sp. AU58]